LNESVTYTNNAQQKQDIKERGSPTPQFTMVRGLAHGAPWSSLEKQGDKPFEPLSKLSLG